MGLLTDSEKYVITDCMGLYKHQMWRWRCTTLTDITKQDFDPIDVLGEVSSNEWIK